MFSGAALFWKVCCFALSSLIGLHGGFFWDFFDLTLFPVLHDSTVLDFRPTQTCPCNFY